MRNEKTVNFNYIALCTIVGLMVAIFSLMPFSIQKGSVIQAEEGCTKSGHPTYVNGVPICDCTIQTGSTCSCIYPCPPQND